MRYVKEVPAALTALTLISTDGRDLILLSLVLYNTLWGKDGLRKKYLYTFRILVRAPVSRFLQLRSTLVDVSLAERKGAEPTRFM